MRRHLQILAATVFAILALPAGAPAQGTNAPPGNSGVDQYLETVPTAKGNRPAQRGAGPASSLPADTREQLEAAGDDGAALSDLVASSAPPSARPDGDGEAAGGGSGASASRGGSEPRIPAAVAGPAVAGSGDGGMGAALPVVLAVVALGGLALALRRRNSGATPA